MNLKDEILTAIWERIEQLGYNINLSEEAEMLERACIKYARACKRISQKKK